MHSSTYIHTIVCLLRGFKKEVGVKESVNNEANIVVHNITFLVTFTLVIQFSIKGRNCFCIDGDLHTSVHTHTLLLILIIDHYIRHNMYCQYIFGTLPITETDCYSGQQPFLTGIVWLYTHYSRREKFMNLNPSKKNLNFVKLSVESMVSINI